MASAACGFSGIEQVTQRPLPVATPTMAAPARTPLGRGGWMVRTAATTSSGLGMRSFPMFCNEYARRSLRVPPPAREHHHGHHRHERAHRQTRMDLPASLRRDSPWILPRQTSGAAAHRPSTDIRCTRTFSVAPSLGTHAALSSDGRSCLPHHVQKLRGSSKRFTVGTWSRLRG